MSKYLVSMTIFLTTTLSFSQNIFEDSLHFSHSDSYRTYKVWVPEDYDSSKSYIPIYCLDASLLFNITWANAEILSWSDIGKIPPVIVVGVFFDHRNDDMAIDWEDGTLGEQGVAFKNFLFDELYDAVESEYNTSHYSVILGHSNSSTYIQDLMLDEETPYTGYIGMSQYEIPSLYDKFDRDHKQKDYVFTSASEDAPYRHSSGNVLNAYLDSIAPKNLNYTHLNIQGPDHISMVNWTMANALETLFKPYNAYLVLNDSFDYKSLGQAPKEITDSLMELRNEKYGTGLNWGWNELNYLYDLQVKLKDSLGIGVSTAIYADLFPEYEDQYFLEGQILEQMGAYYSAEKSYLKHFEFFDAPGEWSYKRIIWLYAYKLNRVEDSIIWCDKAIKDLGLETFVELREELENID